MKKLSLVFWLIVILYQISDLTSAISQDMEVIRVWEGKVACNKGSDDGVTENQRYAIYRVLPTGPRSIGSAQVFLVKSNWCALNVLYNETDYPVRNSDILVFLEESQTLPSTPEVSVANQTNEHFSSPYKGRIGIRGGVGTDLSQGLVVGGSLNYFVAASANPFEIGFAVFTGSSQEKTEDVYTYVEEIDILVFGLFSNYLLNYNRFSSGIYFLVGAGLGFIEVAWKKSSHNDESLGRLSPEGRYTQSDEGSSFGFIFDLGIGYKFSNRVDARFEVPVFITTSSPGDASSVAPTFVFSLGVRFN